MTINQDGPIWSEGERRAFAWPAAVTPSQWAEEHRILPSHVTAEPGPWRGERTPYLAGITDAAAEPGVEEITVIKGAQLGFSECLRNLLGYWIDRDPGPCLVVMPDEKSALELIEERIKPLLEFTPAVARHRTSRAWDVKRASIRLDTMSVYVGWAGSSQAMKSRPIRYLLLEEPDEYPAISGAGGDPISKALKRVTTYTKGRSRVVLGGTPTSRRGNTWKAWEACGDQRYFHVPCPHCGRYQQLLWKQVKWSQRAEGESQAQHAARVLDDGAAWYDCANPDCGEAILEEDKPAMLRRGVWVGKGQSVNDAGQFCGPTGRRFRKIGFHLPSTYSPWLSLAKLASEFIEAQGDVQKLADVINQRLAEPFEQQRAKTAATVIKETAKGSGPALIVPAWAKLLIATADTQGTTDKDGYFYYCIRAWGLDYRSALVDYGIANSKEELRQRCLVREIPMEAGGKAAPQLLLVDSGGPRWSEVYQFSQTDPRIHPVKGENHTTDFMLSEKVQKAHNVVLWKIDTSQAKDLLHRLIHEADRTKWLPHQGVGPDYCGQMAAEAKIFDPKEGREVWVEVVKDFNHLFDCEAYQCAAAWRYGAGAPEPNEEREQREQAMAAAAKRPEAPTGDNWLNKWKRDE